ncbi:MAG: DUF222 domain-containing protein [Actinomycetaceae bacterium]
MLLKHEADEHDDVHADAAPPHARPTGRSGRPDALRADDVRAMLHALPGLRRDDEADAVEQIRALEELVSGARAAQARATADLASMRLTAEQAMDIAPRDQGKGLDAEIALARRESPTRGGRYLGLAKALDRELPRTLELMEQGLVSEWRATILTQETIGLDAEDRRAVDAALAPDLPTYGDRQLRHQARKLAMELDADHTAVKREVEHRQRRVSLRPGDGSMAYLTAHLPMTEAVRVHASLIAQAATVVNDGDAAGRTPAQISADLLVEHVTGRATTEPRDVDLTIVMPAESLAGGREPAWLVGDGPLPADVAREQVREAKSVFFRRLWTDPATGGLVSMESRGRVFTGELRKLVMIRDDACSTPYCQGRVEHVDHATDHADGGATSAANGNGLCARCNYNKQHPGWRYEKRQADQLDVRTPTGHRYRVPRSPFPYRKRAPGPEMTDERYDELQRRVTDRIARNRRHERPTSGGSLEFQRPPPAPAASPASEPAPESGPSPGPGPDR